MPTRTFKVGDITYNIPEEKVKSFKTKFPNAVEAKGEVKATAETKSSVGATRAETAKENVRSKDDETGEDLPFDKTVAGKGNDTVTLDIKPWYGDEMKTNYTSKEWSDFVRSTGFKPTTRNTAKDPKAQVKEFQYYLAHHPDWKSSIDELHGSTGDKGFGTPTKSKKKYDGYLGRRWDLLVNKKPKVEPTLPPDIKIKADDTPVVNTEEAIKQNRLVIPPNPQTYAPWWLQDIVKTSGAAADLARVKKYLPWQDKPEVFLPKATYYDPTRELAANTEQANLASQFHQAFTGPKSGAISGVQGKAFDNAANIMAKYNNLNVGLANQLSQERASIMNQASQNQAGLNTQLWDKYTIANQQFDNSKNMARQNLRQSYMDAITNRGKTQALNTLNPNFYTDPSTGFVNKTGYANITPTPQNFKDEYLTALKITGDPDRAMKYLELQKKGKVSADEQNPHAAGYPG